MKKEEIIFIMDECIVYLKEAIYYKKNQLEWHYYFFHGKGIALKEIIEKLIDCQQTIYYKKYMKIVELYNLSH